LLVVLSVAGCPRSREIPLPSSGDRKITSVMLGVVSNSPQGNIDVVDGNLVTLRVGDMVQVGLEVAWAIPYVEIMTNNVDFTMQEPVCGELDTQGVFVARSPGKALIQSELRVFRSGDSDELLSNHGSIGSDPITTFTNLMTLTIIE
jgi:hypothetical protein